MSQIGFFTPPPSLLSTRQSISDTRRRRQLSYRCNEGRQAIIAKKANKGRARFYKNWDFLNIFCGTYRRFASRTINSTEMKAKQGNLFNKRKVGTGHLSEICQSINLKLAVPLFVSSSMRVGIRGKGEEK